MFCFSVCLEIHGRSLKIYKKFNNNGLNFSNKKKKKDESFVEKSNTIIYNIIKYDSIFKYVTGAKLQQS